MAKGRSTALFAVGVLFRLQMRGLYCMEIREQALYTRFRGRCPTVPTSDHVDVDALTSGDDDPLFLTLQIAEAGITSRNGLKHTEALLGWIEEQLVGVDGRVGHVPPHEAGTTFPVSDAGRTPLGGHWVGSLREGNTLWGKAYIPPGAFRDYVKRLKAVGGKLGTSIYGYGTKRRTADGAIALESFDLHTVDFLSHNDASAQYDGAFVLTAENADLPAANRDTDDTNKPKERPQMPDPITVESVPVAIREQIIRQAQIEADAERVAELEQRVEEAEAEVREARQSARIYSEISTVLGADADIPALVSEMHTQLNAVMETLGIEMGQISIRVEEMHEALEEMAAEQFDRTLDDAIAEMTESWQVATPAGKRAIKSLHQNVRREALATLGENRTPDAVAEAVERVWQSDTLQPIVEMTRDAVSGGVAVAGKSSRTDDGPTEDDLKKLGAPFSTRVRRRK